MNKIKTIAKRIIAIIMVCVVFIGGWQVLRYALVDDTTSYTRITMHEFYEQDNIDILFLGASHCFSGMVPSVLDERFDANTFAVGSAAQELDTTFLLMKEGISRYDVKKVYVDLSVYLARTTSYKKHNLRPTYFVTDYMKPSIRKYKHLMNASDSGQYANSVFLARRNKDKILDFQYMGELLKKKSSSDYKNYIYNNPENTTEHYAGKGFIASSATMPSEPYFLDKAYYRLNVSKIRQDWIDIVYDMIEYCDKHNVELVFYAIPESDYLNVSRGNYDDYITAVKEILAGYDVRYVDFNLMRKEYWNNTSELFKDENHLNEKGAILFSELFADYENGLITDEELFYDSMVEKYADLDLQFYGVSYKDKYRKCKIVTNKSDELEFRVVLKQEDGEEIVVQDFESNILFAIPPKTKGICEISYRYINNPKDVVTYELQY